MFTPIILVLLALASAAPGPERQTLTIYAYDSFAGKHGLAEKVRPLFEKEGRHLVVVSFGSAGEAINQVKLEGEKTRADLVVGVDNSLLPEVRRMVHFGPVPMKNLPTGLKVPAQKDWVPFDYGYPALVYDSRQFQPRPGVSLATLGQDKRLRKKIALLDPRSSSLGRLFLLWTATAMGDRFGAYWKGMAKSVKTYSPGWSGGYSLFTQGEVLMTLSYTTSPAYHIAQENNDAIHAVVFPEGHVRQEEGVVAVRYSPRRGLIQKFLATLLSKEIQEAVPLTNYMYPVLQSAEWPAAFKGLPAEPKALELSTVDGGKWIREWEAIATQ
ncbi:MAG: thiamine ABC transporter substrate-binding protein [Deltaproteobacteria bacterium]|nr:thiamine ABC transporter substrate-binding protein [Deltaproteobacteria bacterium]MBI3294727.1 thiamine ABC transporter substrate-binding protein [Deltaproteobacteria bacterium]